MKHEKYDAVLTSANGFEYTFLSVGPKGEIQKVVQFLQTANPNIYNLAFGDLLPDGDIDDQVKNDNKDRDKILATIAAIVYEFTAKHANKRVFFTGSTIARTRLYRMALTTNLTELSNDFKIFGLNLEGEMYKIEEFRKGIDYGAFLVERKIV